MIPAPLGPEGEFGPISCPGQRRGGTEAVLVDERGDYASQLQIQGIPTNVIVDRHGIVREIGGSTPEDLRRILPRLLVSR